MKQWRVGLWKDQNRIWIDFPYDEQVKEALKHKIQGIRWSPQEKFWHAPLDMDTARDIRAVCNSFGETLSIEPELAAWAKVEKQRYANLLKPDDFSADTSQWVPRLRRERPELAQALETWKHQLPGVAFMVGQKATLLADQPGLGKTIQTLATVAELDMRGPILVVAPRTAVNVTWPEEIEQWLGPNERVFKVTGTLKPAERKANLQEVKRLAQTTNERIWVLCGPNYLRIRADLDGNGNYVRDANGHKIIRVVNEGLGDLFEIQWASVIVDESHQTLAGATGNKKKQSAQRVGLGALDIRPGGLKIAISGTPFRGKTENLWGTLNWLYPEKYTSYWGWVRRHYGIVQNNSRFGSGIAKGDKIIDEQRFFGELRPIMVRRTKREVAKDLPPKMYGGTHLVPNDVNTPVAVWLPMSPKQSKQYNEIVNQALITIDSMGDTINVNGVLAEMTRMKQVANASLGTSLQARGGVAPILPSNKIEWIHDFLVDRIEAGTKTVIASQFTQFIDFLSNELSDKGVKHYKLTGQTKDDERAWIKQEFQKDEGEMVILLNTKAGGVSLTLDAADDVVIVDQTWIPDDQEQVEDRAHRLSRMHNVTIWNLASLGTIDEDVATTNAEREDAIMGILDRQRGVSYVKALIQKTKQRQEKKAA
jgi:SNF2 family DNA or RNA helicase